MTSVDQPAGEPTSEAPPAPDLVTCQVVCHTPDCENRDITLAGPVWGPVVCGPCGHEITDITPLPDTTA